MIVRWSLTNGVCQAEYQGMHLVLEAAEAKALPIPGRPEPCVAVRINGQRCRQRWHTAHAAMDAIDEVLRLELVKRGNEVQARQRALTPQKAAREAMRPKVKFTREVA